MSTPKDKARWNAYDASHRQERRAKDRLRYALNKERMRAKNRAYHAAHKAEILERQSARRLMKSSEDSACKRRWRVAHREESRADTKARYWSLDPEIRRQRTAKNNLKYKERQRQWMERNRDRLKVVAAEWTRNNSARKQAATARRKATKIRATPTWADLSAIQMFYNEAARLTRDSGIKHEVDHIVPLRNPLVCGLHIACNLQILTRTENRRKNNRLIAA